MNMKILGYNIISVMHKKEISMTELSRRMKCDRGNLYYRITNPESMKVKQLVRIGNAIGVDWRDLMEGVEE